MLFTHTHKNKWHHLFCSVEMHPPMGSPLISPQGRAAGSGTRSWVPLSSLPSHTTHYWDCVVHTLHYHTCSRPSHITLALERNWTSQRKLFFVKQYPFGHCFGAIFKESAAFPYILYTKIVQEGHVNSALFYRKRHPFRLVPFIYSLIVVLVLGINVYPASHKETTN